MCVCVCVCVCRSQVCPSSGRGRAWSRLSWLYVKTSGWGRSSSRPTTILENQRYTHTHTQWRTRGTHTHTQWRTRGPHTQTHIPDDVCLSPQLHYLRLPRDISEDYVILMDSTVSTGAAAMMAVRVLLVGGTIDRHTSEHDPPISSLMEPIQVVIDRAQG